MNTIIVNKDKWLFAITKPFYFQIHWSPSGEISNSGCWVIFQGYCWMYTHQTIYGVFHTMISEWQDDKHLIG